MHIKTSDQEELFLGCGGYSCNWGIHIAGLYETESERNDIVYGFLKEGVLRDDLDLFVPARNDREHFIEDFSLLCPECREAVHNSEMLSIYSAKDLYYPDGIFSPDIMDENLDVFFKESQKNGKRNVRATADMIWSKDAIPGIEHLFVYESRLNYFIPGKPWISICLYNISEFSGSTILDVLRTHPFTLNKGIFMENPYYQNPDTWLSENAPEFLPDERRRN